MHLYFVRKVRGRALYSVPNVMDNCHVIQATEIQRAREGAVQNVTAWVSELLSNNCPDWPSGTATAARMRRGSLHDKNVNSPTNCKSTI